MGVVTITDGNINYWDERETAIRKFSSLISTTDYFFNRDMSKYEEVLSQLRNGKQICTDREYSLSVILSAQLALKLGFLV